tara:strand:+ start:101 stop:226 length:126 start_codon:yes stop_codon:yes gene_type:complete
VVLVEVGVKMPDAEMAERVTLMERTEEPALELQVQGVVAPL